MPKKKSNEDNSELEEFIDEEKLEEIIKDVEEEVSPKVNIDENQFREFLQIKSSAPVLEEIAGEQELGNVFVTTGTKRDNNEEDSTNYSLSEYEKPGESKYDEAPKSFQEEVSTGVASNVGLARNSKIRQQNLTFSTPETQRMQRDASHDAESDYLQPKRFEQKNQAMPFEKEDKKYKEFKP